MSLGFRQEGFTVCAAVDFDERHTETYKANFPDAKVIQKDIRKVTSDEIQKTAALGNRRVDVLFGGPPCQGFSYAGKGRVDDPRNTLLAEYARLLEELRPRTFVLENVAGLLQERYKPLLSEFIERTKRLGYGLADEPKVYDARHLGIPQQRKRVLIVGMEQRIKVAWPPVSVSPAPGDCPTVRDAIGDLPEVSNYEDLLSTDVYCGPLGTPSSYASYLRGQIQDNLDLHGTSPVTDLSGCLRTSHSSEVRERFAATEQGKTEPVSHFYRLSWEGVSPTLRAGTTRQYGQFMAPRPIHPSTPRCITVREAARLHSFPDCFQFHATKWYGFMQVGNSVPPLMARAVARVVRQGLEG